MKKYVFFCLNSSVSLADIFQIEVSLIRHSTLIFSVFDYSLTMWWVTFCFYSILNRDTLVILNNKHVLTDPFRTEDCLDIIRAKKMREQESVLEKFIWRMNLAKYVSEEDAASVNISLRTQ